MKVPYAGIIYDEQEKNNLLEAVDTFYLTHSKFCDMFEKKLAQYLNVKHAIFVNSGSSANLLAFMALTSERIENHIEPGDEVITVAACFPTTVAPIVQAGAIPVFIDITFPTLNVDINMLERALTSKTKVVMLAHTLGNPFNIEMVRKFCKENNLWLIEDNCDALGSTYQGQLTGSFGDLSTLSFYPAHHITTGEGGAVLTNNDKLAKIVRSLRDWGRDCVCPTGKENVCGNRYAWYDHKYVYSELGYNLKATEFQGAIGVAQLDKLPKFDKARKENWEYFNQKIDGLKMVATQYSKPSWFGFALTVPNRSQVLNHLNTAGIQTRLLFAGNILKQPCMQGKPFITFSLPNTDRVMNETFFVGVHPSMSEQQREYVVKQLKEVL